jgi:hypothetical protein
LEFYVRRRRNLGPEERRFEIPAVELTRQKVLRGCVGDMILGEVEKIERRVGSADIRPAGTFSR